MDPRLSILKAYTTPLQMQSHGLSMTPVSIKQLRVTLWQKSRAKNHSETKLDGSLKTLVPTRNRHQQIYEDLNLEFANHGEVDEIYPLTTLEIAKAQQKDQESKVHYKQNAKTPKEDVRLWLIEDTKVLYKNDKLIIPASQPHRAVSWYHHYLQHPDHLGLHHKPSYGYPYT